LMGPLLARRGRAVVAPPGGDFPARRSIKTHLEAMIAMGARVLPGSGHRLEVTNGLKPASLYLDEASVTGTETALLAAAAAPGVSEIRHAACEPHVVELCEFLRAMGVGISGDGSHTIRVEGLAKPKGASKTLYGDYIEAGSWAVVGAITGGNIEVGGTRPVDMEVVASVLRKMHVNCEQDGDVFRVESSKLVGAGRITTGLWPGFPSDRVSLVTVLATQAEGATLVHDWMYELRLFALEQMSGMGADLFLCDPHRIIVTGPTKLRGRTLDSRDIRSGMAVVAAALAAEGQSTVLEIETVERGYEDLVGRLTSIGADVSRQG
jgi:UDP-N-acetylglucosamine 1-carboxyvinyltransferase